MKIKNIFKKFKKGLLSFPNRFSYFLFIGLILASFILAAAIFWIYALKENDSKNQLQEDTKLDLEIYKKVEKGLQQREKNFQEAQEKQILDPFFK